MMNARYAGTCARCSSPIHRGQLIHIIAGRVFCQSCGNKLRALQTERDTRNADAYAAGERAPDIP